MMTWLLFHLLALVLWLPADLIVPVMVAALLLYGFFCYALGARHNHNQNQT